MADPIDYSKLSDETLQKMSNGHQLDYSSLPDQDLHEMAKHADAPTPAPISNLSAVGAGIRHLGGLGPITAGAAQGLPDKVMSVLHNIAPSTVSASPTQVNAMLAAMGIKGDVGPTSSSALYNEAKQPEEQRLEQAQSQHPLMTGAGKLAGDVLAFEGAGMLSPKIALADDAGRLAKIGAHVGNAFIPSATVGAMESKNKLIGGTPEEAKGLAKDTLKAGALGSALVGAGSAIAQGAGSLLDNTQMGKDIKGYYDIGKEGKDLSQTSTQLGGLESPQLIDPVSLHDTQAAQGVLGKINAIDDHLGERVGQTIDKATQNGINIQADQDSSKLIDDVFNTGKAKNALEKDQDVVPDEDKFDNTKLKKYFDLANRYKSQGLNPAEMQEFRNELGNMQRRINYNDPYLAADLRTLVTKLTQELKSNVPGYEDAANRLNEFRKEIPETILSKDNPTDITRLRMSGIRNVDTKLVNQLKSVIRGLNDPNNVTARGTYTNMLQGLQRFQTKELMRQASGKQLQSAFDATGISPESIQNSIQSAATKSKLLQDYTGLNVDPLEALRSPTKLLTRPAGYLANKLGSAMSGENTVLNTGKKLYSASDDALQGLADKLDQVPAQKTMAGALRKAIEAKNPTAKNAVLFSLMQNPDTRKLIQSGEFYVGAGE